MDKIGSVFLSLNQGKKFDQKKKKEGFTSTTSTIDTDVVTDSSDVLINRQQRIPVFLNQYNRMKENNTVSDNDFQGLNQLQDEYDSLVNQLAEADQSVKSEGDAYLKLTSTNNPFLSKNIVPDSSDGSLQFVSSEFGGYVTDKGVFKNYADQATFDASVGKNGCPINVIKGVKNDEYSSLIQNGTDMKRGQSCGNEGKNVYVSRILTDPATTYQGCFYDPSNNPLTVMSDYSFDDCKTYAIENGYKYFGIRGAPNENGKAGCMVTNDDVSNYESASKIVTPTQLWSSSDVLISDINGNPKASGHTRVRLNNQAQLVFSNDSNEEQIFAFPGASSGCEEGFAIAESSDCDRSDLKHITGTNLEQCKQRAYSMPGAAGFVMNDDNGSECWIKHKIRNVRDREGRTIYTIVRGESKSNCHFFMILQDDGNLCIYKGLDPSNNLGGIWCTMTNGKASQANLEWQSKNGKFGVPYMMSGIQHLKTDEWIGSSDGKLKLMMVASGDLVLYTSTTKNGCAMNRVSTGINFYGNTENSNAIYQINEVGVPANLGNVAYIDNNSTAHLYPSDMLGYSNNYTIYPNFDSTGNDLGLTTAMGSIEDCKTSCNTTTGCSGFVWAPDDTANQCQLKNANMFPNRAIKSGRSMYIRRPNVDNNGDLCNKQIADIDTLRYANYEQGEGMTADAPFCRDAVISETSKAKIKDLQSRMVVKGQEISAKIQELYQRDKTIFDKMDVNNAELKKKISQYMRTVMGKNTNSKMLNPTSLTNKNSMKEGMQNLDMSDINGMLADTDLRVLQENYSYVLWSVLAVGLLTITINVMKASNK